MKKKKGREKVYLRREKSWEKVRAEGEERRGRKDWVFYSCGEKGNYYYTKKMKKRKNGKWSLGLET